jgi:hypothetical protein
MRQKLDDEEIEGKGGGDFCGFYFPDVRAPFL